MDMHKLKVPQARKKANCDENSAISTSFPSFEKHYCDAMMHVLKNFQISI